MRLCKYITFDSCQMFSLQFVGCRVKHIVSLCVAVCGPLISMLYVVKIDLSKSQANMAADYCKSYSW